jgi:site-specific recombinase XerC
LQPSGSTRPWSLGSQGDHQGDVRHDERQHIVGAKPVDKLRHPTSTQGKVELQGCGLAESSIRSAYTVLRAVFDTAVRDRAIAHNPAHAVRRPKVTTQETAYLTPDQARLLLVAAESSRYAPLSALLVHAT